MLEIAKIKSSEYRKNIVIEKKDTFYYVTSVQYESESEAQKALHAYKKVFNDAFIEQEEGNVTVPLPVEEVSRKKEMLEEEASKNETNETVEKEELPQEAIENVALPIFNAKTLLENKTVYVCYEDGVQSAAKQIIRLDFKKEYVGYSKLINDIPPIDIPYIFDRDSVILTLSGINFTYQIYAQNKDFLSVKNLIAGKEGDTLRYYFDKALALAFVGD